MAEYDSGKYPEDVYDQLVWTFRLGRPTRDDVALALRWKWGHLAKKQDGMPAAHSALIEEVARKWPGEIPSDPLGARHLLWGAFGGSTRFITVAFLLHLLFPAEYPIIDKNNWAAVRALLTQAGIDHRLAERPSQFGQIGILSRFLRLAIDTWPDVTGQQAPSTRQLDKYLMMFGRRVRQDNSRRAASKVTLQPLPGPPSVPRWEPPMSPRSESGGVVPPPPSKHMIPLPYGGPNAAFDVQDLVGHVQASGLGFIVIGGQSAVLSKVKQHGLDWFLRTRYSRHQDTRQTVRSVIDAIVDTGFFAAGSRPDPKTGRMCEALILQVPRSVSSVGH